jgi:hypothetical protein
LCGEQSPVCSILEIARKTTGFKQCGVLVFLYVGYLLIVLLLVNPALNYVPALYIKQLVDRELITQIILFNPFTLNLEVRKAEMPEHSGERFIHSSSRGASL